MYPLAASFETIHLIVLEPGARVRFTPVHWLKHSAKEKLIHFSNSFQYPFSLKNIGWRVSSTSEWQLTDWMFKRIQLLISQIKQVPTHLCSTSKNKKTAILDFYMKSVHVGWNKRDMLFSWNMAAQMAFWMDCRNLRGSYRALLNTLSLETSVTWRSSMSLLFGRMPSSAI